ncbi:leukotoxin LktA family filamentous adhesin, partial [bacterium]|nr:leukotoxin LktA family filamentous adhesin [bacterium]
MIQNKAGKRKVIASALTFCFFLQQSFCLQVMATNVSGAIGDNGIYNVAPSARNGDIGYRKYANFDVSNGDVLNLIFNNPQDGVDVKTFLNLVDNQINIQGLVNAVNKNGTFKNDGHAVFISPKGMIVGSNGVINVGAMTALTPDQDSYEAYKRNVALPSLTAKWKEQLGHGNATVKKDGRVLARDFVNIEAANVEAGNNALIMSGVRNDAADSKGFTSKAMADALFTQLVNTDNLDTANAFKNNQGSISITSYGAAGGTDIAGTMKNFSAGDITVNNSGSKGINVSGTSINGNGNTKLVNTNGAINVTGNITNQNGELLLDNTGSGILIASTGKLTNSNGVTNIKNTGADGITFENGSKTLNKNSVTNITNSGAAGINVRGHVTSNGINVDNKDSNVVIGYDNNNKDYLTSTSDVNINVKNGNVYNSGVASNLIKANGDLTIDVQNGAIGKE